MKYFYVSSRKSASGISQYSADFYELVLKKRNYIFVDSGDRTSSILSRISSRDRIHIEIGIFQKKEIELLFLMLKANYRYVSITLHDAPLLKYPYFEFKNPILNNISKLYERYTGSLGAAEPLVKKLSAIYVLTEKGVAAVKKKYRIDNVYYMPHVINPAEIATDNAPGRHLIYFGFIGRNKGIEYALDLHRQLVKNHPDLQFYVVGKPLGKEVFFYHLLREKYTTNVHYCGYLEGEALDQVFDQAGYAILPFRNYRFFWPVSGSVLYSMKKGKIVLASKVNSIPEIIENGSNGFFLSGNLIKDNHLLSGMLEDQQLISKTRQEAFRYLHSRHSPELVGEKFEASFTVPAETTIVQPS